MEKKYLVCYFHWTKKASSGFGNIVITEGEDEDIYTPEEISNIENLIVKENNFSGCCVQNIIPLN